jgi:hypothetical protein
VGLAEGIGSQDFHDDCGWKQTNDTMTKFVRLTSMAVAALASVVQSNAAPNLVLNGGFDTMVPIGGGSGGDWTSFRVDSNGGWIDLGNGHGHVYGLNDNGDSNSDPTIYQNVTGLVPGGTYHVSGEYMTHWITDRPSGALSFAAGVDTTTFFQAPPITLWSQFSFNFKASASGKAQIWLKAETNGTDNDFVVDNISMVQVVPEPSTYLAGLSAIGMLGFFGWRNRK